MFGLRATPQAAEKRHKRLASELQHQAGYLFLDRSMLHINDSLTSILAICDVVSKDSVPRIKKHIQEINGSLQTIKRFQLTHSDQNHAFHLPVVMGNILSVVNENFKDQVSLLPDLSDIKAYGVGSQSQFEKIVFYLFVKLMSFPSAGSDVIVELRQKGQEALVVLLRPGMSVKEDFLADLAELTQEWSGKVQLSKTARGHEVLVRLPILFKDDKASSPHISLSGDMHQIMKDIPDVIKSFGYVA